MAKHTDDDCVQMVEMVESVRKKMNCTEKAACVILGISPPRYQEKGGFRDRGRRTHGNSIEAIRNRYRVKTGEEFVPSMNDEDTIEVPLIHCPSCGHEWVLGETEAADEIEGAAETE